MNHTVRRRVLIGLAPLAAGLALAGCASSTAADEGASPSRSVVSAESSSTSTDGAYTDGTYSADGSYVSPGGTESVGVELTIADGVVTAVTVTPEADDATSAQYQQQFASGISDEVVGVALDQLHVDKVAGSSLTSGGFEDAVTQIEEQARA
ncbi:hypothetical protein [Promicromonospora sp. NPDC057488]|uniref:FMN-binding protein n=1 Tax=Promicromonospora sp. NPDC057488 TaxID=3346147 RepID=UPI0036725BAA